MEHDANIESQPDAYARKILVRLFYAFLLGGVPLLLMDVAHGRWLDLALLSAVLLMLLGGVYVLKVGSNRVVTLTFRCLTLVFIVHQFVILDIHRTEVNIGVIWFIFIPVVVMLIASTKEMICWVGLSLVGLLFTWWRAPIENLLWQHPLTLPHLMVMLLLTTIVAYGVIQMRNAQLAELNDLLDKEQMLSKQYRQLANELRAEKVGKERFYAEVSHELRTPLMYSLMTTELLSREQSANNKHVEHLNHLVRNTKTMVRMLDDVLDLERIAQEKSSIVIRPFLLIDILRDVVSMLMSLSNNANLTFGCRFEPGLENKWLGDSTRIQQIINNLISNSVKNTLEGHIEIRFSREKHQLKIEVLDSGVGIPADKQEEIFAPYSQIEHDIKPIYSRHGIGLGLAISREYARVMGGDLTVASELGSGSRFSVLTAEVSSSEQESLGEVIKIPKLLENTHRLSIDSEDEKFRSIMNPWFVHWNIDIVGTGASTLALTKMAGCYSALSLPVSALEPKQLGNNESWVSPSTMGSSDIVCGIAEDNDDLRNLMREFLIMQGFDVMAYNNGQDALEGVKEGDIQLLLLDQGMPLLSGVGVVKKVRKFNSDKAKTPICILSGNLNFEQEALTAGADLFMSKPAGMADICASVHKLHAIYRQNSLLT